MKRALLVACMVFSSPSMTTASGSAPVHFQLDALSLLSFDDKQFFTIPTLSVPIHVFASDVANTVALRVEPRELGTRTVPIRGATFSARLARPASGHARRMPDGAISLEIEAVFRVSRAAPGEQATTRDLPVRLTTEALEAWNAAGTKRLGVSGMRLDAKSRVVQLVGKSTAGQKHSPVPGAAVYIVLSGTLDRIPEFRGAVTVPPHE